MPPPSPKDLGRGESNWGRWIVCGLLLLVLALRLTASETLRLSFRERLGVETLGQGLALEAGLHGPLIVAVMAGLTLVLAFLTPWVTRGRNRTLSRQEVLIWGLMVLVVAGIGVSVIHAVNLSVAFMTGLDLLAGMLGGWALGWLARDLLCRRLIVGMLLAVLAMWCIKGANQYFVEFPETAANYQE
ncbi:MAG: hypothetical protein WCI73_14925, partial [Phycisphaerae bacterium]